MTEVPAHVPELVDVPVPHVLRPGDLALLADAADDLADGHLHLLVPGVIGFAGVSDPARLRERVSRLSADHGDGVSDSPIGWHERPDALVDLGAGLRLGRLTAQVARMLDVIGCEVQVGAATVTMLGLADGVAEQVVRVLAPLGLVFDAASPWLAVTACQACHLAVSDVHGDATQAVHTGAIPADQRVHVVGCAHACGRPAGAHVEYLATGDGEYEVTAR